VETAWFLLTTDLFSPNPQCQSFFQTDGPQRLSLTDSLLHSLPVLLCTRWIMHWPTPAVMETLCSYQEYTLPSKRVFISVCLWIFLLGTITLEHLFHKTEILNFLFVCWQEREVISAQSVLINRRYFCVSEPISRRASHSGDWEHMHEEEQCYISINIIHLKILPNHYFTMHFFYYTMLGMGND